MSVFYICSVNYINRSLHFIIFFYCFLPFFQQLYIHFYKYFKPQHGVFSLLVLSFFSFTSSFQLTFFIIHFLLFFALLVYSFYSGFLYALLSIPFPPLGLPLTFLLNFTFNSLLLFFFLLILLPFVHLFTFLQVYYQAFSLLTLRFFFFSLI